MRRTTLCAAIAIAVLCFSADALAKDKKPKAGHKFKGGIELQERSNDNINAAPSSGNTFDFADIGEFGDDDDEAGADDEEEEEDDEDFDDFFDDVEDVVEEELDEDDFEEDDAIDEDGDGIDDLIDPNADTARVEENRFTWKFGLGHKYTFANGTTSWNNAVKFASDTHADDSEKNKFNSAISTGFDIGFADRHSFKPALSYVTVEKDTKHFVSTFVASLGYELEVNKNVTLSAQYNYQDKDLSSPSSPDSNIDTFAIGADWKISENDILKVKYSPKVEDSSQVTRNTDAWGYDIAYTRKLPADITLGIGYQFDNVEHENLTPVREDDTDRWAVQLTKAFGKKFTLGIGYEKTDKEVNIPNKDAENKSFYVEAGYKW